MLFTSLAFFAFLPLVLVLFATLPARHRWAWLLIASYGFYGAWAPFNLIYLGAVTAAVFLLGRGIEGTDGRTRTALLVGGLILLAGSLVAFKFYDFTAGEIERLIRTATGVDTFRLPRLGAAVPAGFSFYAFSALSYLIDVYLRRLPGKQGAGEVALYLGFFPKILAGPIERAPPFLAQLRDGLRADPDTLVLGLQLIGWGLVKKVVIADNLAPLVDRNFAIAAFASPVELLISVYFFAFQIYCDFSGYTDIAIGVSLLFGIRLMENFRRPYLARSTAEFWAERWHISLGRWFRDYLYIPLGGGRAGRLRHYANIMVVFLVSGLWHAGLGYGVGWTFLVWGALNGIYQWIAIVTRPLWRSLGAAWPRLAASLPLLVLRVVLTFHLIAITWVFFRAKSVGDAILILRKIAERLADLPLLLPHYPFTAEHAFGAALIALLVAIEILDERRALFARLAAAPVVVRWSVYYVAIFALLVLGRWQAKEFIYMQF